MAWIKTPAEHHPIFRGCLPRGVTTKTMFGSVCAFVNDNMFGGLFARSIMVKLSDADRREALALDGAEPFDPMGNGRVMTNAVLLPESVMDDRDEMRAWLARAYEHVKTLPPKRAKPARKNKSQGSKKRAARPKRR
jgi:TfoX/Sxy family transcriptional regulator of competence genes